MGKSTLIRTLIGEEEPTSGTVRRSDRLTIAYFDQTRETLDPEVTVSKTLCPSEETMLSIVAGMSIFEVT